MDHLFKIIDSADVVFERGQSWTNCVLMFLLYIPVDSSLLCCFLPPRAEGYSVLLFEVDICIIRLRCSIVSRSPHQRVLQRREGAVQPNNGSFPSSLTLHPACTCIPPSRPTSTGRSCLQPCERRRERKTRERQREKSKSKEGGGIQTHEGSGRAGVEQDI